MATTGAQRAETRLTVKDVLDAASSEGLRMTTEIAEDYLIRHCVSLWNSMQACGREYVLECLKKAFREQRQNGGVHRARTLTIRLARAISLLVLKTQRRP